MTRVLRSLFALAALLWVCAPARPVAAQTYTPKAIHFEGSPGLDPAGLLSVSGLHQGVPLTKAEIEAGLQKLADTGSFTDISYTVNDAALTITLTSAAGAQALPVRFTNFVWWQPEELERAVEARVPLYHGQLALTGSLTDPVKSALIALAREKGLNITVAADRSTDDAFFGKSIPDAAVTILQSQRRKMSTQSLMDTMEQGGLPPSKYNTVYSILRRRESQVGDLINLQGEWALAAWHPNHVKKRPKKAGSATAGAAESEQEEPQVDESTGEEASNVEEMKATA